MLVLDYWTIGVGVDLSSSVERTVVSGGRSPETRRAQRPSGSPPLTFSPFSRFSADFVLLSWETLLPKILLPRWLLRDLPAPRFLGYHLRPSYHNEQNDTIAIRWTMTTATTMQRAMTITMQWTIPMRQYDSNSNNNTTIKLGNTTLYLVNVRIRLLALVLDYWC